MVKKIWVAFWGWFLFPNIPLPLPSKKIVRKRSLMTYGEDTRGKLLGGKCHRWDTKTKFKSLGYNYFVSLLVFL